MAVLSFLNYYDFSGKTIYTLATSGGSSISESTADVQSNAKGATVVEGRRFSSGNDKSIESWLNGLGLIKPSKQPEIPEQPTESNILIVYFSATGSTERVAGYIADATGGDVFELVIVNPYSSEDLNYGNQSSRVVLEHNDESLRNIELIKSTVDNWDTYDIIFIGYPIWWGISAWPVNNFIKDNDFTGKTVIPFATSASSG
ncbi:MAG: flavodoxin, partial [Clostridia bacterium]|nr:flavodoxin [Clostridia bacterium]